MIALDVAVTKFGGYIVDWKSSSNLVRVVLGIHPVKAAAKFPELKVNLSSNSLEV